MYDKAYRWVGEMEEISDFLDANPPSRDIYAAIARLYDYLAAAEAEKEPGPDNAIRTLDRVLGRHNSLAPLAGDGRGEGLSPQFGQHPFENSVNVLDNIIIPDADDAVTEGDSTRDRALDLQRSLSAGRHQAR